MAKEKDLSNNEHNAQLLVEINKLEELIKELRSKLKKTEAVKYTSLADCNAMTQKHKKEAAELAAKAK